MSINEIQERIIEIEREISVLPAGSITTKKIKNRIYYKTFSAESCLIYSCVYFEDSNTCLDL